MCKVGRRKTNNPIILEVDAKEATRDGMKIKNASEKVYVTERIPAEFIKLTDWFAIR